MSRLLNGAQTVGLCVNAHLKTWKFELWAGPATSSAPQAQSSVRSSVPEIGADSASRRVFRWS